MVAHKEAGDRDERANQGSGQRFLRPVAVVPVQDHEDADRNPEQGFGIPDGGDDAQPQARGERQERGWRLRPPGQEVDAPDEEEGGRRMRVAGKGKGVGHRVDGHGGLCDQPPWCADPQPTQQEKAEEREGSENGIDQECGVRANEFEGDGEDEREAGRIMAVVVPACRPKPVRSHELERRLQREPRPAVLGN